MLMLIPSLVFVGQRTLGSYPGLLFYHVGSGDGDEVRLSVCAVRALAAEPSHRSVHLTFIAVSPYLTEL